MAGRLRASMYAGGRIVCYAAVTLGLLAVPRLAWAQDAPPVPQSAAQGGWDATTAPPAKLKPKSSEPKAKLQPPTATTPQLRSGTADDAVSAGTKVVKHSGLKGVPHVIQSELPPVADQTEAKPFSVITTGAISEAGAKNSGGTSDSSTPGALAQQSPDAPAAAPAPPPPTAPQSDTTDAPTVSSDARAVPVTVGLYINDVQDIDFHTNNYIVDLYLWFRWKDKDLDPIKSVEFMNVFDPQDAQRTVLLDTAKQMPDGSLYNIVRYHGRFSKKFLLEKYPFDAQKLEFVLEDSVSPSSKMYFVPDTRGISINPHLSLPGFKFDTASLEIVNYTYPTDFGDLSVPSAETYSRAIVTVPIHRPVFTLVIKTLGPILLIVICSTLVFFINPHFVEGRIGLAITALLTLVAIQFTAAASLPDADYFTMLDKLYMLSYAFIIAALVRVVMTSWQTVEGSLLDVSVAHKDHRWGLILLLIYAATATAIASWVLSK